MTSLASRVTLRPATASDDEFLVRLCEATRLSGLNDLDGRQRLALAALQVRARRREYDASFPGAEQSIVELDGSPIGQIWVALGEREHRLLDIALLPEQSGRGIGTILVGRLVAAADQARKPVRLTVRSDNTAARRLYERAGFTVVGTGLDLVMERAPSD
jgi:ribosomal protein S18 acetylase RimI-like enzyme